jgi:D-serine dehydratase
MRPLTCESEIREGTARMPDRLDGIPDAVRAGRPTVWRNPHRRPAAEILPGLTFGLADVADAEAR